MKAAGEALHVGEDSRAAADDEVRRVTVQVRGMRCASCARTVERVLAGTRGVCAATVNFAAESTTIGWDPGVARFDAIRRKVSSAGFELIFNEEPQHETAATDEARTARDTALRLAVGVFFSMNSMLPAFAIYAGIVDGMAHTTAWRLALASGVLATPVLLYSGQPFFAGTYRSLRHGAPGMDFLVATGAALAFGYSWWQLATGSTEVYFDTASMIVTLMLVGRTIERFARQRGGDAVRELLRQAPETARVLDATGAEHERPVRTVPVGALVRLRPGERSPVDGIVLVGASSLDRSLLTGESNPIAVGVGQQVEAGTVNCEGALTLRVTAAAGARVIDGIVRAVDGLLASRAPLVTLSDRAVRVFVPAVTVLAIAVGVSNGMVAGTGPGILRAVSILVIACPCALGLATPMAILVAAGAAARRAILFRDGEAIERAANIDLVLFDKTGTLTKGQPQVVGVHPAPGVLGEEVLATAAEAEAQSEHPIARALVAAAGGRTQTNGTLVAHPGLGVTWSSGDQVTLVGNARLLREHGVVVPAEKLDVGTPVEVARNGHWLGRLVVNDALRSTTPRAVDELRMMGIGMGIISGDAQQPVLELAKVLHFSADDIEAECTPVEKARTIERRGVGHHVAFVGDGLNDAVALCAAHLGVAATGATDLAMQVAHVTLREDGIGRLPEALALARRTRRVMRQNIAWAMGYNLVALPIAIFGAAPPVVAALAMALSSITVVANSLRLRRVRHTPQANIHIEGGDSVNGLHAITQSD